MRILLSIFILLIVANSKGFAVDGNMDEIIVSITIGNPFQGGSFHQYVIGRNGEIIRTVPSGSIDPIGHIADERHEELLRSNAAFIASGFPVTRPEDLPKANLGWEIKRKGPEVSSSHGGLYVHPHIKEIIDEINNAVPEAFRILEIQQVQQK